MAINTTAKRQAIAADLVQHAAGLREVLFALRADAEKVQTDGLTFQDADFTGALAHLDAATVNALLTAIPQMLTALRNNGFDVKIGAVAGR